MRLSFLICLALLSATCSDDDHNNTCAVNDPLTELDWLKEAVESYQGNTVDVTVEQGTYHFMTVFIIIPCCPMCKFALVSMPVYNCKGEVLEELSPDNKGIKDRKVIWKTPAEEAECW